MIACVFALMLLCTAQSQLVVRLFTNLRVRMLRINSFHTSEIVFFIQLGKVVIWGNPLLLHSKSRNDVNSLSFIVCMCSLQFGSKLRLRFYLVVMTQHNV